MKAKTLLIIIILAVAALSYWYWYKYIRVPSSAERRRAILNTPVVKSPDPQPLTSQLGTPPLPL